MPQMKAILVEEFGEPEVLRYAEIERPGPGEGELLIEVRSAGIIYADTMRRRNQYLIRQELPFVPGSEVAGVAAGDRVVSIIGTGDTPSTRWLRPRQSFRLAKRAENLPRPKT